MGRIKKRVFLSCPAEEVLDDRARSVRAALVKQIRALPDYELHEFRSSMLKEGRSWSIDAVDKIIRLCHGGIHLGLPARRGIAAPSESSHCEGAIAAIHGVPILVLAEASVLKIGFLDAANNRNSIIIPANADHLWLEHDAFKGPFEQWQREVDERKHVFLGYCSGANAIADQLHIYLSGLGFSVLDWKRDFRAGKSILEEVSRAARMCLCGIFLFTKDDELAVSVGTAQAAPRDNVVFEMGYFVAKNGKHRALVIREEGAKMPADLGGDIYLLLTNRDGISQVETQLRAFLEQCLHLS